MKQLQRKNGFTIVELLIVIVVIAILAAITIVAYNGIQVRAKNAKTISAARQYYTSLLSLKGDLGRYPTPTDDGAYVGNCLGEDYPNDKCFGLNNIQENAALNAKLKQYISPLPMPSTPNGGDYGVMFVPKSSNYTLDGTARDWLAYVIEGKDSRCDYGPIAKYSGSGTALISTTPSNGQSFTPTGSDIYPACWIALPQ